ncbi:MAG: sugar phosphate isomerase/epimerase [Spirochaetales bacterium]|nr:sugar phosphate isomerase/epimerase [Spirochaetales bacterium]
MFLATHDKPFLPLGLVEKLRAVKALGFDAYEADGGLALSRLDELRQAVDASGVPVVALCGGYRGWIGHFDTDRRRECLDDLSAILAGAASLGAYGAVVPAAWGMFSLRLPPMTPPRGPDDDRAVLLDSLSRLEDIAGRHGVFVFLEPLNRYEDHMVNHLSTAAELIRAGSFSRVRICADFYHMNIEEDSMAASVTSHAALIGHVHLADSQRFQPGSGHTDFLPGLRALRVAGYDGAFSFECRVKGDDPEAAYRSSVGFARRVLGEAGYLR